MFTVVPVYCASFRFLLFRPVCSQFCFYLLKNIWMNRKLFQYIAHMLLCVRLIIRLYLGIKCYNLNWTLWVMISNGNWHSYPKSLIGIFKMMMQTTIDRFKIKLLFVWIAGDKYMIWESCQTLWKLSKHRLIFDLHHPKEMCFRFNLKHDFHFEISILFISLCVNWIHKKNSIRNEQKAHNSKQTNYAR